MLEKGRQVQRCVALVVGDARRETRNGHEVCHNRREAVAGCHVQVRGAMLILLVDFALLLHQLKEEGWGEHV